MRRIVRVVGRCDLAHEVMLDVVRLLGQRPSQLRDLSTHLLAVVVHRLLQRRLRSGRDEQKSPSEKQSDGLTRKSEINAPSPTHKHTKPASHGLAAAAQPRTSGLLTGPANPNPRSEPSL